MRNWFGLSVLWVAAVALVLVAALVPEVDEFAWGSDGSTAWGRVVGAATLVGLVLGFVWNRLLLTLLGWSALLVAVWAGYAFNAGAWGIATLGTGLLLALLLVASGQVLGIESREAEQRREATVAAAEPPSPADLRAARASVQAMIDERRGRGGVGELEALRGHLDQQIREQERSGRAAGR
ncbi:MAG: hypothetical protein KDB35_22340 [Acidimicrobiales bacterium]|nr:hypothetical protein [Acidimicrobiales bacterium]MCB1014474.1 hypothetical protein [Acidimicrobiales bacterium]MCB9373823.1 hypothetical protein [Microthrixaceae bacterium]